MTCRDVMTADPRCCLPEDTVARAASIMREEDVGPVPIVKDRESMRLVGILTDRDIAVKVAATGRDPRTTRVEDVMSRDLIVCQDDEDYREALEAMSERQVRRVPVVDKEGCLCGIIAQADVARRSSDSQLGQVVEEISEPASLGRSPKNGGSSRRSSGSRSSTGTSFLAGAAAIGIGAAVMYLLDPDRGRSRRAKVKGKASSIYGDASYYGGKVQRDIRNRVTGVVAGAKSLMETDGEVTDQKLEARVRSRLGRLTSHPHAVTVTASEGRVTLEGPILQDEISRLLISVRAVPGVKDVENRLEGHRPDENIPELKGQSQRGKERWEHSNWSPSTRFIASTLGGGLALYGWRANGPLAKATASVGVGLLARGLSNRDIKSLTDLGSARKIIGV